MLGEVGGTLSPRFVSFTMNYIWLRLDTLTRPSPEICAIHITHRLLFLNLVLSYINMMHHAKSALSLTPPTLFVLHARPQHPLLLFPPLNSTQNHHHPLHSTSPSRNPPKKYQQNSYPNPPFPPNRITHPHPTSTERLPTIQLPPTKHVLLPSLPPIFPPPPPSQTNTSAQAVCAKRVFLRRMSRVDTGVRGRRGEVVRVWVLWLRIRRRKWM